MENLVGHLQSPIAFFLYAIIFIIFAYYSWHGFKDQNDLAANRYLYILRIPIALIMAAACFYMAAKFYI